MPHHNATVHWSCDNAEDFANGRYSRAHEWTFDGGQVVKGSSSPSVVGAPMSDPFGVDPEEALVAAVSSCHMLWFLHLASRDGIVVRSYEDAPVGEGETTADGAGRFVRATLRPRIGLAPGSDRDAADRLHAEIGRYCFIARSVSFPVGHEASYFKIP